MLDRSSAGMIKRFQRHCFGRLKLLDAMWWNAPYPVSIIRPLHHFVMVVEHASRRRLCPTVTIDKCHPAGLFVCQFVWHLACRFLCFFLVFPCTSLFWGGVVDSDAASYLLYNFTQHPPAAWGFSFSFRFGFAICTWKLGRNLCTRCGCATPSGKTAENLLHSQTAIALPAG